MTMLHDSPAILVFDVKYLREIRTGSSLTGTPNVGGVGENWRLFKNNSLRSFS